MRIILCFILLFGTIQVYGQDTIYYDTLIKSAAGDHYRATYTSRVTGIKDTIKLKQRTWDFYDRFGNLVKRATYKVDEAQLISLYHGEAIYFDEYGDTVLVREYKNNEAVKSTAFQEVVILEGISLINVVKQYGEFVVFEHLDRFKESKIQTEYVNLRGNNELSYYLPEEERLKSEHLLDTALYWPNDERNYVQNPMFENHPRLAESKASFGKKEMEHWQAASPTPDFFLSEDCKSGTGCIGFRVYSLVKDIEYIQNQLGGKLKKDSLYCFSMYVKLANQCGYTSNGLGVHFSKKPVEDVQEVIKSQPNLLLNENYLPYKTKWMLLQCQYRAEGGEKYLTIGSFKKLSDIALTKVNGYATEAYYIIDDVSLVPISDTSECKCNLDKKPVESGLKFYDTLITDKGWEPDVSVGESFVLENVYFDNDKFDLLPESLASLRRLLKWLEENETVRIEIGGHTSSIGDRKHNIELSTNRAKSVRSFLVLNGISRDRLEIRGYGPDYPIDTNDTPEGQAKNRRVEVEVLSK